MRRTRLLTVHLPDEHFEKLDRALETLGQTGVKPTRSALVRAALDAGLAVITAKVAPAEVHHG